MGLRGVIILYIAGPEGRAKGEILMVGKMIVGVCLMAGLVSGSASGVTVTNFHSDDIIEAEEVYDIVNVWENANVVMTGGSVGVLYAFDSSTFTVFGGEIGQDLVAVESSSISVWGGTTEFARGVLTGTSAFEIGGGIRSLVVDARDETTIDVWGYGFQEKHNPRGYYIVEGYWANGSPFWMNMSDDAYGRSHFHVIPEPGSLGLLALGGILLHRRYSHRPAA